MATELLERPRFIKKSENNCTDSNETILLAQPPKSTQNRYRFKQMLDYCGQHNKELEELTDEEKLKFKI